MRLGDLLKRQGLLDDMGLKTAFLRYRQEGGRLGEALLAENIVNPQMLYQTLATQQGLPYADLLQMPPDETLLKAECRAAYLRYQALPWKREMDGTWLIATSQVTDELRQWAERKYGAVRFALTTPFDVQAVCERVFGKEDEEIAREQLVESVPYFSAKRLFFSPLRRGICFSFFAVMMVFSAHFAAMTDVNLMLINVFFLLTLLSKLVFFWSGSQVAEIDVQAKALPADAWPCYTLLIPLFKENDTTIEHLRNALMALDYPRRKLDVKLIVEADDTGTIASIKAAKFPSNFRIVRVPYSLPQTKPKACNYALRFAEGEYVTIYDAEDRPEPDQLKKAVIAFRNSDAQVACFQARLNYYNRDENWLTRLFAIEYASWFCFMLPGLLRLKMPIPLGGTSNHFRLPILRQVFGWDAYNVTEDADLGLRLMLLGYRTGLLPSTTWEECPQHMGNWMRQRSRWIKGYMQTFAVHIRHPVLLLKHGGVRGYLGFCFFVGAPAFVFLLLPVSLILSLFQLVHSNDMASGMLLFSWFNLIFGVLAHWLVSFWVLCHMRWWHMAGSALSFPFYWVLHSVASFRALWQLFYRPHYWEKTEHGHSQAMRESLNLSSKTAACA